MDDLAGMSWSAPKGQNQTSSSTLPQALRPTPPVSGRSTPLNPSSLPSSQKPSNSFTPGSKSSTPGSDSFANLVSFNAAQPGKNISLQEQQRLMQEQKAREAQETKAQFDTLFGGQAENVRTNSPLSNGHAIPTHGSSFDVRNASQQAANPISFSQSISRNSSPLAFNPTTNAVKPAQTPPSSIGANAASLNHNDSTGLNGLADDDDDPFGLGVRGPSTSQTSMKQQKVQVDDNDDVLGDLNRPVSEFPKPSPSKRPANVSKFDRSLAELTEMGFPPEKATSALEHTESGTDVQAAVSWLLNRAHEESAGDKHRGSSRARNNSGSGQSHRRKSSSNDSRPAWMKENGRTASGRPQRKDTRDTKQDKAPAQIAQELGNNLFKTANSLWKTGTKKLNQAVAEFNADVEPSQPKWMREGRSEGRSQQSDNRDPPALPVRSNGSASLGPATAASKNKELVTDEALLLESGGVRPTKDQRTARRNEDMEHVMAEQPFQFNDSIGNNSQRPKARLNRQAVEEEAAQAYVSPARRKRPSPSPQMSNDLLSTTSAHPEPPARPRSAPKTPSPHIPAQKIPTRNVPSVPPHIIHETNAARKAGSEAFKRGDYAQATADYTRALSLLPKAHPLTLLILTNRALSHLKTGDPKASLADSQATIDFLGPSKGTGELVDIPGEESKPMNVYWGKAMTRQAEALEQLEKWKEALAAWQACVEAGVGGVTSIQGRDRCEQATKPKPKPVTSSTRKPAVKSKPKPSALNDLTPNTALSTEAVTRLRAANAAADQIDDEKFRLSDHVDAKILQWRQGKEGNLRALLSSLETVLWADAGWTKVSMGDVLLPGKVKVIYMKGIARVHPDKLPTNATTEQKMISAAVFATLNEAWEKFKQENGL